MIDITQENYYSKEVDKQYLSFSSFKNFISNPARALADLNGEYPWFDDDKALLIGNYLHSYFEGGEAHDRFKRENADKILSSRGVSKGKLKSEFEIAQKMIDRLLAEPQFAKQMDLAYRSEQIISGEIEGVMWKGKVDRLDLDNGVFYDFKTVKTLVDDGAIWDNELRQRVPFIISRKYHLQMAIYAELLYQNFGMEFTPVIWAVSKEKEPLAKPYIITKNTLNEALNEVIALQDEVIKWRDGLEEAPLLNDGSLFYNYKHRITDQSDYGEI